MPIETDTLLTIGEIAATFAGFAALVSAIRRRSGDPETTHDILRLRVIISSSVVIVVMALIPLGLSNYGLSEVSVWRTAAIIYLLLSYAVMRSFSGTYRVVEGQFPPDRLAVTVFAVLQVAMVVALATDIFNLMPELSYALYITALIGNLCQAAFIFVRFIESTLNPHSCDQMLCGAIHVQKNNAGVLSVKQLFAIRRSFNATARFAWRNSAIAVLVYIVSLSAATGTQFENDKPTVLITGANASHGFAFANDYAALGWNVIATCRTPEKADRLKALAGKFPNIVIEELDIVDFDEIDAVAEKYRDTPIDVLLLNAAINSFRFGPNRFGKIDYDWFEEILKVNVIGQLRVSEAFLEQVASSKQKKIIAMTSTGGSITNVQSTMAVAYRSSKAALNMMMRMYSIELKDRGVIVSIMAPGTVDTEDYMNAEDPASVPRNYQMMMKAKRLAPRTAINDMIALIDRLTLEDSGVYYEWTGTVLPW